MDLARFRNLLDAKGTDLARWPEPERRAAERLLVASAEATEIWHKAAALEHALAQSLPSVDPARAARLAERVIAQASTMGQFAKRRPARRWQLAAVFASLGILGFALDAAVLDHSYDESIAGDVVSILLEADAPDGSAW